MSPRVTVQMLIRIWNRNANYVLKEQYGCRLTTSSGEESRAPQIFPLSARANIGAVWGHKNPVNEPLLISFLKTHRCLFIYRMSMTQIVVICARHLATTCTKPEMTSLLHSHYLKMALYALKHLELSFWIYWEFRSGLDVRHICLYALDPKCV